MELRNIVSKAAKATAVIGGIGLVSIVSYGAGVPQGEEQWWDGYHTGFHEGTQGVLMKQFISAKGGLGCEGAAYSRRDGVDFLKGTITSYNGAVKKISPETPLQEVIDYECDNRWK